MNLHLDWDLLFVKKLILAAFGIITILLLFFLSSLPDGKLHIFVLDVGQGDSVLIQTPGNEKILVDGGPDDKAVQMLGKVMPFYEKNIDLVILTHPHADHVNGLVQVLRRYHIGTVMMTGVNYAYPGYESFLYEIRTRNIPVIYAGAKLAVSAVNNDLKRKNPADYRLGSVVLDMIYPFSSLQGESFENQNNGSIVFRLLYGKRSFYFSGDMEMEGEEKLIRSGLDLRADFLKAPHHGSKTSDTIDFLRRVHPVYAAISCGVGNKFGHPNPITLDHFQNMNIQTYRTDLDGMIEAVSDGQELEIKKYGK